VCGPHVAIGYWAGPSQIKDAPKEGWSHTGAGLLLRAKYPCARTPYRKFLPSSRQIEMNDFRSGEEGLLR
jgi:hypothetical protein